MASPLKKISPESVCRILLIKFSRVVFPEPFGPIMPTISCFLTLSDLRARIIFKPLNNLLGNIVVPPLLWIIAKEKIKAKESDQKEGYQLFIEKASRDDKTSQIICNKNVKIFISACIDEKLKMLILS